MLARARPGDRPAGSAPTRVQVPTSVPAPSAKEEEPTCSWSLSNDKGEEILGLRLETAGRQDILKQPVFREKTSALFVEPQN
jgi:hypothetical protein